MQNWQDGEECNIAQDLEDAQKVCDRLKIKLHLANFSQEYWHHVFKYFLDECAAGRTPNPDILCNREIKFNSFLKYAQNMGADYIATGHYARLNIVNHHNIQLLKGLDENKDQSYFLHQLNQGQLQYTLFPLGELVKDKVRQLAREAQLANCQKKDSMGICFIGKRNFRNFLREYLLTRPGNIVTREGKVMGRHEGLMFYTIGQRKGIGIGGQTLLPEAPWYVAVKDSADNSLIVTQSKDDLDLFNDRLICHEVHWISMEEPSFPLHCTAKIRYRQRDEQCTVTKMEGEIIKFLVKFKNKQWAITPGQSIVFYHGDECLGGAIIEKNAK